MVEWRPLMGALPPLNDTEWTRVFDLYKSSPEYTKEHYWMDLGDFKRIFFWEWFHRVLARSMGLIYALPMVWFWARRKIPSGFKPRLILLLILGGSQGLLGWYMVQSGLIDRPTVSHYRLAAHLGLALTIFSALVWTVLDIRRGTRAVTHKNCALKTHAFLTLAVIAITILWGAFTAGMDAGLVYTDSFPKMGGQWVPPDMWHLSPRWINLFENHAGIQFTHRWLGMGTVLMVLGFWAHGAARGITRFSLYALPMMAIFQMGLGIATLLSGVAIPLSTLHQAGAVILLLLMMVNIHALRDKL